MNTLNDNHKKGRPKKTILDKKELVLRVRITVDEFRNINEFCQKNGMTKSELAREAINIYIKQR